MQVHVSLPAFPFSRPDGMRHSKTVNGAVKTHLWDGQNIVAESANDQICARYYRGANLIAWQQDANLRFYLHNAHGDVVHIVQDAQTLYSYDYDAFGNEKSPNAEYDGNPFRYCGEYYDREIENVYLRARYYDTSTGRFTQEDTHWTPQNMIYGDEPIDLDDDEEHNTFVPSVSATLESSNLYGYCANNPMDLVDQSGQIAILAAVASVALPVLAVGAAVGTVYYLSTPKGKAATSAAATSVANAVSAAATTVATTVKATNQAQANLMLKATTALAVGTVQAAQTVQSVQKAVGTAIIQTAQTAYNEGTRLLTETHTAFREGAQQLQKTATDFIQTVDKNKKSKKSEGAIDLKKTVKDVLKTKQGDIKKAPLKPGSPSWDQLLPYTLEQILENAQKGEDKKIWREIWKLFTGGRFNK